MNEESKYDSELEGMAFLIEAALDDCEERADADGMFYVSSAAAVVLTAYGTFEEYDVMVNPTLPGISVAFHVS